MRWISGQAEPTALTEWRLGTPGLGYSAMSSDLRSVVKSALIGEQRSLCAYTGLRIDENSSHLEHLLPQTHCEYGEDIAFGNLVACYPAPSRYAPFGAVKKDDWPSMSERQLFVSPRSEGCEARFSFDLKGTIKAANEQDESARTTIAKLGLDHRDLQRLRKEAIDATLQLRGKGPASLDHKSARKRLLQLERAEQQTGKLEQFSFVLKQAIQRHLNRLQAIANSRSTHRESNG